MKKLILLITGILLSIVTHCQSITDKLGTSPPDLKPFKNLSLKATERLYFIPSEYPIVNYVPVQMILYTADNKVITGINIYLDDEHKAYEFISCYGGFKVSFHKDITFPGSGFENKKGYLIKISR